MSMWFRIHAFCVETKILCKGVHERSLLAFHRSETETLCLWISSEKSELLLLRGSPRRVLLVHIKRVRRVWNMIALMIGIHVESKCEFVVALKARTLLVTL
jgi:hypothetical protein